MKLKKQFGLLLFCTFALWGSSVHADLVPPALDPFSSQYASYQAYTYVGQHNNGNRLVVGGLSDTPDGHFIIPFLNAYDSAGTLRIHMPLANSNASVVVIDIATNKSIPISEPLPIDARSAKGKVAVVYLKKDQRVTVKVIQLGFNTNCHYPVYLDYFPDDKSKMSERDWFEAAIARRFRATHETALAGFYSEMSGLGGSVNNMLHGIAAADLMLGVASSGLECVMDADSPGKVVKVLLDPDNITSDSAVLGLANSFQKAEVAAHPNASLALSNSSTVADGLIALAQVHTNPAAAWQTIVVDFAQAAVYGYGVYGLSKIERGINAQYLVKHLLTYQLEKNLTTKLSEGLTKYLVYEWAEHTESLCGWFEDFAGCGLDNYNEDTVWELYENTWVEIHQWISDRKLEQNWYADVDHDGFSNSWEVENGSNPNDGSDHNGAPNITVTIPQNELILPHTQDKLNLYGTAYSDDGASFSCQVGNNHFYSIIWGKRGNNTYEWRAPFVTYPHGLTTVQIGAKDNNGNFSKKLIKVFREYPPSPNGEPVITVTTPESNFIVPHDRSSLVIKGNIAAPHKIKSMHYQVGNNFFGGFPFRANVTSYQWTASISGISMYGKNDVYIKAEDQAGNSVSKHVIVTRKYPPHPTIKITTSAPVGINNLEIDFQTDVDGQYEWLRWEFGDGAMSYNENAKHTYTSPGAYLAKFLVGTHDGKVLTRTVEVVVFEAVTSSFIAYSIPNEQMRTRFENESSGSIARFKWNFGDGTTSTDRNATHVYASPGTYTVSLFAAGNGGESTFKKEVIVEFNNDLDADGMNDDWELKYFGTTKYDGQEDYDQDGLTNGEEEDLNLNPTNTDTDLDGMPDGWEVKNGLDPLNNDASKDNDLDHYTNLEEFLKRTDPNNIRSVPPQSTLITPILNLLLLSN